MKPVGVPETGKNMGWVTLVAVKSICNAAFSAPCTRVRASPWCCPWCAGTCCRSTRTVAMLSEKNGRNQPQINTGVAYTHWQEERSQGCIWFGMHMTGSGDTEARGHRQEGADVELQLAPRDLAGSRTSVTRKYFLCLFGQVCRPTQCNPEFTPL